jgi:CheY-like chemotaxis protein
LVAQAIVEQLGFSADVAENGIEALESVARAAYSAVLMDCQMPEMDGYTATSRIRLREGSNRHTPVIAMTAAAMEGDRERCLKAGMDDYISKPIRPEDVEAALVRWVDSAAINAPR